MLTNKDAMVIGVKETLRYGLFLGTFAGMFVSVDECIAAIGGHKRLYYTTFLGCFHVSNLSKFLFVLFFLAFGFKQYFNFLCYIPVLPVD